MKKIPCIYFRGGTSKGPCFLKEDLPASPQERDALLLKIMGSPHEQQIDGIGGANSLSSKVVIVNCSQRPGIDLDYLLCQVHIDQPIVETSLNCGNMLSAVLPFAIETGLVKATHPETTCTIYNENTDIVLQATVQTPQGKITYEGTTEIDGVPGTSSPIKLTFFDSVGSKTGKLLPTGNVIDHIDGIAVSCLDVAVPMVIVNATAFNKTGYETKTALNNDKEFLKQLETLRCSAAVKMQLGNATQSINPKICLVAPSREQGTITSRYFTPSECHDSHAVSGALCLAAACLMEGSVASTITGSTPPKAVNANEYEIIIEHPAGKIISMVTTENTVTGINFPEASFIRTARPLFEGCVWV